MSDLLVPPAPKHTAALNRALNIANAVAAERGHSQRGLIDLLLAMLYIQEGMVYKTLADLDLTYEKLLEQTKGVNDAPFEGTGLRPLTAPADAVLTKARDMAASLFRPELCTEHVLLAMLDDQNDDPAVAELLIRNQVHHKALRDTVYNTLCMDQAGDAGAALYKAVSHVWQAFALAENYDRAKAARLEKLYRCLLELTTNIESELQP